MALETINRTLKSRMSRRSLFEIVRPELKQSISVKHCERPDRGCYWSIVMQCRMQTSRLISRSIVLATYSFGYIV